MGVNYFLMKVALPLNRHVVSQGKELHDCCEQRHEISDYLDIYWPLRQIFFHVFFTLVQTKL